MIIKYATFDRTTGVTSTTSANLGQSLQLSASINSNLKLTSIWNVTLNGDFRYNRIERKIHPHQLFAGTGGNGSINTFLKIGKVLTLSSNAGFVYQPLTAQVQNALQYWYGSGLGLKMLKEKLTLSLNCANFLDRFFDYKSTVRDQNFITTNINTSLYRRFSLSLLWSFGKLTDGGSKKKGVYNDDVLETEKKAKQ
jgi:hypothetical protein